MSYFDNEETRKQEIANETLDFHHWKYAKYAFAYAIIVLSSATSFVLIWGALHNWWP